MLQDIAVDYPREGTTRDNGDISGDNGDISGVLSLDVPMSPMISGIARCNRYTVLVLLAYLCVPWCHQGSVYAGIRLSALCLVHFGASLWYTVASCTYDYTIS